MINLVFKKTQLLMKNKYYKIKYINQNNYSKKNFNL